MKEKTFGLYFIDDAFELRDKTKVGDVISFNCDKWRDLGNDGSIDKTVTGEVLAKYPRVFMLSDGNVYSWVDYLLGRIVK